MSMKLKHEIRALERRIISLHEILIEAGTVVRELTARIEALEQRKKPGPKPKNQRDSGNSSEVSEDVADRPTIVIQPAIQ